MESKLSENFLSVQCKDKGGGGLMISLVKIVIHKQIFTPMPSKGAFINYHQGGY